MNKIQAHKKVVVTVTAPPSCTVHVVCLCVPGHGSG